jgi:hypothetical protein
METNIIFLIHFVKQSSKNSYILTYVVNFILYNFIPIIISKQLLHMVNERYAGKMTHIIIRILIHHLFHVARMQTKFCLSCPHTKKSDQTCSRVAHPCL